MALDKMELTNMKWNTWNELKWNKGEWNKSRWNIMEYNKYKGSTKSRDEISKFKKFHNKVKGYYIKKFSNNGFFEKKCTFKIQNKNI